MSAVGTIPDNEDKRPPDIIADKQIHRAATDPGTFAETPPPRLPQLPVAGPPNILPQLPVVVPPNIEDVIRDISLATFRDQAKTITINGQTPEVTGGKFSFEIPTQPPASVQFAQLNPSPQPPPVPIVPPPVAGSVTTLQEMEAASAARNTPKTSSQRRDEEIDEMVARRLKADPDYKPSALASNEEKEAYQRVTNPAANPSGFSPTQLTPQLQQQLVASVTLGATGVNWLETKGTEDWDEGKNKPKFGEEKNRLPGETRSEQEDREEKEYHKQKKEYREKEDALEEERPGQRRGEGVRAYTERTNEDRLKDMSEEETAAVANGDSSYFYKGFIPILFTRADGNRKILARLDNTHSVVIEGAVGNERQGTLPEDNGYYLAGGGDTVPPHPWKIDIRTNPDNSVDVKVDLNSRVHKGIGTWDQHTVVGLNSWTSFETGYVVVWATIVDGDIEPPLNIDWAVTNNRVEADGQNQPTYAEYRIAYLYYDTSTDPATPKVLQIAHSNLTVIHGCYNGKPVVSFVQ